MSRQAEVDVVVSQAWLGAHPEAIILDVRWYLDGRSGRDAHEAGHIPGAVWVDMNTELAGPATPASGRHPLPSPDAFAAGMRRVGVSDDSLVVAYDDAGGAQAGRLVWLLRTLGCEAAILDGGLQSWVGTLERGVRVATPGGFAARGWASDAFATIDEAASNLLVLDARAPQRYRGETEPVDARAGHIPGASNAFFVDNLNPDGTFKSADDLRARFGELGVTDAAEVICYCGSGVTACHNLIAMERAGLGRGRLYVGSWSQYAGTSRPAATA